MTFIHVKTSSMEETPCRERLTYASSSAGVRSRLNGTKVEGRIPAAEELWRGDTEGRWGGNFPSPPLLKRGLLHSLHSHLTGSPPSPQKVVNMPR